MRDREARLRAARDLRRRVRARDPSPSGEAGLRADVVANASDRAGRAGVGREDQTRTCVLAEYLPTLLFLLVAAGIGVALIVIGNVLGPKRPTAEKLSPYECGFAAFEDARMKFDVRYYLIAILFIVFDLEIAFVFPWAVVFRSLGVFGLVEMGVFLALLVIGFAYVWKKGALEWE
jgi:NADH-quinone oxidoreductase subunit A